MPPRRPQPPRIEEPPADWTPTQAVPDPVINKPYEEPKHDSPRRNEELVAEAAASGELYAPPEPPPPAQRAWDEEDIPADWEPVVRIDAGATDDAAPGSDANAKKAKELLDQANEELKLATKASNQNR